jgi:hypothetical protein
MSVNAFIRYFDLQAKRRGLLATSHGTGGTPPAPVIPQYLALAAGIIVQPYLTYYVQHGEWVFVTGIWGRLAFGLILAGVVFPGVYKAVFDPGSPLFVQLCAIFSTGIGWQSLIQGGAKAALGVGNGG